MGTFNDLTLSDTDDGDADDRRVRWHAHQAAARTAAQANGLTHPAAPTRAPLADGPELLSLAYEIMGNDRFLSLDQALDAAAAMQSELLDVKDWWLKRCVREELALVQSAEDWDQRCAYHYATQLPIGVIEDADDEDDEDADAEGDDDASIG